ncbi:hypothetical protein E2K80_14635 [Rhodophyticola sp. CCM32]|uniref:type VI secretion system-associated protein TagO n=1 Tax=Rhodophyticola sp. CCM32 TaxID=2916397 RepID=UPI00107FA6D6|nr:type VI secretion system-associated protein TagO [Rhodophyticola sp. CCM32]QBY01807.1 hypothetical protein E2K80_14635 [Rhodophyticola sp. CCM32]
MRLSRTAVVCALFMIWGAAPLAADEPPPDCSAETVGVHCVEMRDVIGPWAIEEVVPPVGSQNALQMSSTSFQPLPGIFGREEEATLILSCVENTTRFEVRFGENFMSDIGDFATLIYKVDDQAPVALATQASEDNTALGLYVGTQAIPFIVSLFGAERLFISATAFTGRTLTASFSIEGLEAAVSPLRTLCNW